MKIIVMNGYPMSGKTTAEEFIQQLAEKDNFKVGYTSIIDVVKDLMRKEFNWNGEKTDKVRKTLHELKIIMEQYDDIPFKSILAAIAKFEEENYNLLFIDMREEKDINRLKAIKTIEVIRIIRPTDYTIEYNNYADTNVDNVDSDITIINKGTLEEFYLTLTNFYKNVLIKEIIEQPSN